MGGRRFLTILIGLLLFSAVGMAQVTVVGTDTYPADVNNVQAAVMVPGAKVYLKGVFNFGNPDYPDDPALCGRVILSAPGVTLRGCRGATIKGGYHPLTTLTGPGLTLPATAKNLTIRDIRFEGWGGFAIYHMGVQDEDNVTRIERNTFINTRWPAYIDGYGIHYCTGGGKAVIRNNKLVDISMMAISTHDLTLHMNDYLIIEGNEIVDAHYDAVCVNLWDPFEGDHNNGPVFIRNNKIGISDEVVGPFTFAINVGYWYGQGISNALIEGNVLSGNTYDGIFLWGYGHGRKVVNNDLSRFTACEGQVVTWGRRDLIAGNKLGPVDTSLLSEGLIPTAILLFTQNFAEYGWPFPEPEAVTKNTLFFNDFRRTGLPGWALDATGYFASMGCVLLLSSVDMGWNDYWPGCEVTGNKIMEFGKFPAGTGGPTQQVLEYPIYAHDNWIFGQTAGGYTQLSATSPGLGLKIRDAGAKLMERMAEKRAFIKEHMPEKVGR